MSMLDLVTVLRGTNIVRFSLSFSCNEMAHTELNLDDLQIQWGSQDHYEVVLRAGRNKYSEVRSLCLDLSLGLLNASEPLKVFEGLNVVTGEKCLMNVFKLVNEKKIN